MVFSELQGRLHEMAYKNGGKAEKRKAIEH
jgi:hypothetical protein